MAYVFSTLANDQNYTVYADTPSGIPQELGTVFIRGGTGIANDRLITPIGVSTQVDEDQLKLLEMNQDFQLHKKKGFIKVQGRASEAEKVASDMNLADPSAPLTPASYRKESDAPVMNGD